LSLPGTNFRVDRAGGLVVAASVLYAVTLVYSINGVLACDNAGERRIIPIPTTRVRSATFQALTTALVGELFGLGTIAGSSRWRVGIGGKPGATFW